MRYRTAGILYLFLLAAMFVFPAIVWRILLPSLNAGLQGSISGYERALLEISFFCMRWRFVLALPMAITLLGIAEITRPRAPGKPANTE